MAARAQAQAASSFEQIPLPAPVHEPHRGAYALGAAGLVLIGSSFAWAHVADDRYDRYLAETDPGRIPARWNATVRADRLASGSLLTGETLLAAAVYLRFIRRPGTRALSINVGPDRCALAWHF